MRREIIGIVPEKLRKVRRFEKVTELPVLDESVSLEELYGIKKKDVELVRVKTESGKWLEKFKSPGKVLVQIDFPEFTCRCPRTSQPDFANIKLIYVPKDWCVELKAYKYYLNSFRDEGHFHEQVMVLMEKDLRKALEPVSLYMRGEFNRRGGTEPIIEVGDS
jgi:7-cyano-7-deazaguanine reductase